MLYPEINPYRQGFLSVSPLHRLYFEESGNPIGQPVVFLHGGPGSGTDGNHRRYFDPQHYRIILFDQRGAGKSVPHASLEENDTFELVKDLEKLKAHLQIDQWIVFGGSWGSLLGMVYALMHPESIKGLILRGIFLCSEEDLNWFYNYGAPQILPDAYEQLLSLVNPNEGIFPSYHKLLNDTDPQIALNAAKIWSSYEAKALKIKFDQEFLERIFDPKKSLSIARIECHYFLNRGFLPSTDWLVSQLNKLNSIPMKIIHGRYDIICPVKNAWLLKKACPNAQLVIVEGAGHAGSEPGIAEALILATNEFKKLR